MKKIVFLLGVSLFAMSCSSDDDSSNDIDYETLHGEVQGSRFTAKGGMAFYRDTETIAVDITNEVAGCESDIFEYGLTVSVELPAEEGVYNNINVAFLKKGETPYNALGSTVIIDKITETSISLRIDSDSVDDINDIEGSFTLPICE